MSVLQPVHSEDLAMVACIVRGDEVAMDEFARKFSRRFEYLARCAGIPAQDCQDIAQEAMLAALDQIRRGVFRGEGPFGGWLARIVRGKAMDYWRERRGAAAVTLDEPGEANDILEAMPAPMSDYELIACVHETLRTLPRQHRVILLLKRTEGYTLQEISRMLEMTTNQVSGKLYVAEEMFRRSLRESRTSAGGLTARSLPAGDGDKRRRRREQSTDHRPLAESVTRMRHAGDQPVADGILLWASQQIAAAIRRGAFAGM